MSRLKIYPSHFIHMPSIFCLQTSKGFTLVEVLISLTLLTIVVGSLYASFNTVQRAISRFDNISIKYHEARTALDLMRREIESSLLEIADTDEEKDNPTMFIIKDRDIFANKTSVLNFTSFSLRQNSVNNISYFIEQQDGKLNLMKKEMPAVVLEGESTLELIEDIKSFTVETLFDNKWVKTWNSKETRGLPEVIRATIEFEDNKRIIKLTEYSRPRIGTQL